VTVSASESYARELLESVEREASRLLAADLSAVEMEFF
jgi:hypothetical protein